VAKPDRRREDLGASAQTIARAASMQLTEDDSTERAARMALKRIAAGPDGALAKQGTETLRYYFRRAVERIAELEAQISDHRKFLRKGKGRRVTLARLDPRNFTSPNAYRCVPAESPTLWAKAVEEQRHYSELARADIAVARAEIRRIRMRRPRSSGGLPSRRASSVSRPASSQLYVRGMGA
jgi:hypothetical protein